MASISKSVRRLAITPLSYMLSARIVNGSHRIIPTGRISHICGSTFLRSMTSVINADPGEEMIDDTLSSETPTGVAEMAEEEEAGQSTEGTVKPRVKKGKSKYPTDPVANLCQIMDSRRWSSRLEHTMKLAVPTLNHDIVMKVLGKAKTAKQAYYFFKWAEKTGFKHNRFTYFTMVEILGRVKKLNAARTLVFEMPNKGVQWNDDVFNSLVKSYGKMGIVMESVKLFDKMKELGVKHTVLAYNNFFSALIRSGRTDMAKRYYNRMLEDGLKPDMFTYNILIRGFCVSSKVDAAHRFLNDMISSGLGPTIVTFNTLIDGFCRVGRLEDAVKVFNQIKEKELAPTVITYTTLIKGYCKEHRADEALEYFKEMVMQGVNPDRVTYITLIPGLCDAQKMNEAEKLLTEMVERDFMPNASLFNALIEGHCKAGNMEDAIDTLDQMGKLEISADLATYNTLIVGLFYRGKFDESIEVFDKLLQKGVLPDPGSNDSTFDTYYRMLKYLCEQGQTQKAEELFRKLLKKGAQDASVFNTIIIGHCKEGTPEAGFELLNIMLRKSLSLDSETYTALIESFLHKALPAEARYTLDKMMESGHLPTASTFRLVIDGLYSDGRFQTASRVMKSMLEKDIKENFDLIPKILETLLDRGHVEEVFDRLELMFGKGCVPDLNELLNDLCVKGKSFTACQLLQFALQKSCKIKAATYDTVLNGLCTDGKSNHAFYLLFRITKKGSRLPTLTCYETLFSSLQAEGKTEQAELISSRFMGKSKEGEKV